MRLSILLPLVGPLLAHACTTEMCFGSSENATTLHTRDTPSHLTSYKTWVATPNSCWSDLTGNLRTLDSSADGITPGSLTVEMCLDACEAQGFFLAGVEYSQECYCGNTVIGNNRPVSDQECSRPCSGNAGQICGGAGALNMYVRNNYQYTIGPASVLNSYNGYTKTQCWQDSVSQRILPAYDQKPKLNPFMMTVQTCIDACAAEGFTSAGLEYARECYCGNITYPAGQSVSQGECDMACLGDATQICGGRSKMLIYNKPDVPTVVTKKGILQVTNTADNAVLGFVSSNLFSNAQARYEPNEGSALIITFPVQGGATSASRARFTAPNGVAGFPLLGLIQGRDDVDSTFQPGSYHYGYFGGVNPSPPGSEPQNLPNSYSTVTGNARTSESDVWNIDLTTGSVTPQWINPGKSPATTQTFSQSTALYVGGDRDAFFSRYPAPVISYKLTFLERP